MKSIVKRALCALLCVKKAFPVRQLCRQSHRVPSSADDGIKSDPVFSGDRYLGKNTSQPASVRAERVRVAGCIPSRKCLHFRESVSIKSTRSRALCALLCALPLLTVPVMAAEPEPVRIAFLDSGISLKHLDPAQVAEGENLVFPQRDTDDRIGHGTATAGLVLGSKELGLEGTCPSAIAVPLVCADAYSSGVRKTGDAATAAKAIRLGVDKYGCRIINASLGLPEDDPELREAVEYARKQGAIIVAAVGNDNLTAPEREFYPAAYEGVIGVGAADGDGAAKFSQRSGVDVLAPGVNIAAATNRNGARAALESGTSFACAYISGVCAEIWSREPSLSAEEVCDRLFEMAQDVCEPGYDTDSGWGIVQTGRMIWFADIGGHWAWEDIRDCYNAGIMNGVAAGSFAPNGTMTRAMFAQVLYRIAGEPETDVSSSFEDVEPDAWYADAVSWGKGAGIMTGVSDTRFGADAAITREQLCTMLVRYLAMSGYDVSARAETSFADEGEISAWAVDSVSFCASGGIVSGRENDRFAPGEKATRAECCAILQRMLRSLKSE